MSRHHSGDHGASTPVPPSDATAVHPCSDAIVVHTQTDPVVVPKHSDLQVLAYYPGLEVASSAPPASWDAETKGYQTEAATPMGLGGGGVPDLGGAERKKWWTLKRTWLIASAGMLAIVGVVLGCVFGLRTRNGTADTSTAGASGGSQPAAGATGGTTTSASTSTSTIPLAVPTGTSTCKQTSICRPLLALVAETASSPSADTPILHIFARSTTPDRALKYTSFLAGGAPATNSSSWTSLGGRIEPGPAAIFWSNSSGADPLITIIAKSTSTAGVIVKNLNPLNPTAASAAAFRSIGGAGVDSVPAVCAIGNNRIDVWAQATSQNHPPSVVAHEWIGSNTHNWLGYWDSNIGDRAITSRPGVVCRPRSENYHDVVVFGNETGGGAAWHRQYGKNGWQDWVSRGGSFAPGSEPVLVEVASNRFDFFGVGTDAQLHHWSFTDAGGYSSTEAVGEPFVSVPAVVVTGSSGNGTFRMDVVAVGGDGVLKHRALLGSGWSGEWEDMGVVSNAAPSLVKINDTMLGVGFVAVDGMVWFAAASTAEGRGWGKLDWKPAPGL